MGQDWFNDLVSGAGDKATADALKLNIVPEGAEDIVKERGLSQISDTGALDAEVAKIINTNAQAVADYKAGKAQSLKFLVGQVMKATRGRANPKLVSELLKKKLEEG